MKSYDAGSLASPIIEETIGENFERIVGAHPDVDALVDVTGGRSWTYRELDAEINLVARGLISRGVDTGDRVGIWAPNCAEWVLVQYATAKIGAILVTINPAYRTHELAYALNQSGVRTLICATAFKSSDYVTMVDQVRSDAPTLLDVVFIGTDHWADLVTGAERVPVTALRDRMSQLSSTDPINIQYTSGTTGYPKGATLSHRNILNNGYFVAESIHLAAGDRLCIPVPFYHCFGQLRTSPIECFQFSGTGHDAL